MKVHKASLFLLCLLVATIATPNTSHARMLEDWEIGISKQTPQAEKESRRASYMHYKAEADALYIGEWINKRTGKPLTITADYWGEQQYTYRSTSFDYGNLDKRILHVELEGHKRTIYFDVSKPNEFTAYNPEYKITSQYIRKQ